MTLDFACAGRDTFLALLALDEMKNASLAIGQHERSIAHSRANASSNEQMSIYLLFWKARFGHGGGDGKS